MTQNLAVPSQEPHDVVRFVEAVTDASGLEPLFLEEVLGPDRIHELPSLRAAMGVPVAGGEVLTRPEEMTSRIRAGCYDIAQPDATVLGGVGPVLDVFRAAHQEGVSCYTHCWGAGVGVLANYHAAVAGGGDTVEWPLPEYALREVLMEGAVSVQDGVARLTERPGLGIELTKDIEGAFPFRQDAVYNCLVNPTTVPTAVSWR